MAKKIRPAIHWQSPKDPTRLLAMKHAPAVAKDLKKAIKHFRDTAPWGKVARLIRTHNYHGAAKAVDYEKLRTALKPAQDNLGQLIYESAKQGAGTISGHMHAARLRKAAKKSKFAFDLYTEEVQDKISDYQDALITALTDDAQAVIYDAILSGVQDGMDAEEVAARVREVIGLTDRQAMAVENYRNSLEELNPEALDRGLRDESFDSIVQDAIDSGDELATSLIDDAVEAYAENYLDYRALQIANTESVRAASIGLHEAYGQAIDRGVFPADAVRRYWRIALDERTCDICMGLADDNEDGVAVDEPFDSDDGPVDDPPVHPSCRCTIDYVTNLDMVNTESDDDASAVDEGDDQQEEEAA